MILLTEQLTIGYGKHVVQSELNLQAHAGELVCMLGTNGCGKSTLLRTLAGLQLPLSGRVLLQGDGLERLSAAERAQRLALVLTERVSVEHTLVHDVVAMGRYPYAAFLGGMRKEDNRVVEDALMHTGLVDYKDRCFNDLSDGEKQRVLIAKALAQDTPAVLLDEPTAHLDLPNRINTFLLLRKLAHENGKAIVVSTHELDLALQFSDRVWLMISNEGVITDKPDALLHTDAFSRAFADDNFHFATHDGNLRVVLR
ncbi:MAG: ABC transporter ATP-binding protein [Paludibacter sp.]|nr:ABC transporter ATP-binding protein [Bacteroidales bacterium]MCM1069433.1 ABC transporter ATP-binding protein [Prevotella sp.]MCM1353808.1 ABC transporter ATP-binding protein [Bacteroides sp.]MCM1442791.1 ABC transporter ATP-binding protein [Muribaculum sp.]MCM1481843.1 ABC transporter ATP-binding protein [Paludibacter sp.]